jgi:isocitrate dehydrogenase
MPYVSDAQGRKRVTVIPGDGIGPEVTVATQRILDATGVKIAWEQHDAGAEVFKRGLPSGVPPETIASIRETRVALKGPLETPVGFGEKSANVTLRKLFETYANIRPVRELPGIKTPFTGRGIDLVIVRENVEDLYAGIEHMQTPGVAQCLKLMSKKGCERIVRVAFELAVAQGRKSVHCATKANIMKLTEGLLKRTFEEVAREYPNIAAHHIIVDNCAHQLVKSPEAFEVIVTSNMNGDILSDLTSGLIGGLGFAPGANLGDDIAIFEAVHGSAPKYAGKNVINPTAVLLSATMMLRHLDEPKAALDLGACSVVNVKVGRVGGLESVRRIHALCTDRRVPMWCGGMLETGIGRAHNIHLATMPGFVYPGDTASASRTYARDIVEQQLETTDGIMPVPAGAGIGVTLDRPFLDSVTLSTEVHQR